MKRILLLIAAFLLLLLTLNYFNVFSITKTENTTFKMSQEDPFKNTIVESLIYHIDTQKDTLINTVHNTKVVFLKDCFVDAKGQVVKGNVSFEFAEAFSLDEILFSNLTTTSNKSFLETGGMLYVNASIDGKEVFINPKNPIYIEVPTPDFKPDMKLYQGTRDQNGNMNWVNPKPLQNYLVSINLNLLDFLPNGFEKAVRKQHQNITIAEIDSIYYGLRKREIEVRGVSVKFEGIDSYIIKTIKAKEYQNTYIATREFEERLQYLFHSRDNTLIELYINNLDKNMWEVDEMVANMSTDSVPIISELKLSKTKKGMVTYYIEEDTLGYSYDKKILFNNFAKQRKTNVREGVKYAQILQGFYEKKLKENRTKLNKIQEQIDKEEQKNTKNYNRLLNEYRIIEEERQTYRMQTYGFILTEKGWINIDRGTQPKKMGLPTH